MVGGNVKYVSLFILLLIAAAPEFHTCNAFNVDPYQSGLLGQLKELGKTPAAEPAGKLDLLGQRQNLESQLSIEQDKQKRAGMDKALEDQRKKQAELLRQQQQTEQLQKQHGQAEQLQRQEEQAAQTQRHQQMLRQQGQAEQTHRQKQQTGKLRRQQGQAEQLRLQQQQHQQQAAQQQQ
jgi:hypothetical protein